MSYRADKYKEQGNIAFKNGQYAEAEALYSKAIQANSSNPVYLTNRANARLKLNNFQAVIDDCLSSITLLQENMKAFYFLAKAQLSLNHPNEALSSALTAYNICSRSPELTTSAYLISDFVRQCKQAKFAERERARLASRNALLRDLLALLEREHSGHMARIAAGGARGELSPDEVLAQQQAARVASTERREEVCNVWAAADPQSADKREVPDHLVDLITFEIMSDPVVTKHGHSYERVTIVEALKRSPVDPLTREPLTVEDLRPNIALRNACDDFWKNNRGWAYEW